QPATRDVVCGQFSLFLGERLLVLAVPADHHAMAGQNGTRFRREKAIVLLIRPVSAVPEVGRLAIAVADAVEAVENPSVMRRMDLGIIRQSVGDDSIASWGINVVEDLVCLNSTGRSGLVERMVVVRQHRPVAQEEINMIAGVIVPAEAVNLG